MYQSVSKFMIYVQQCIQSTTPLLCRISVTLISRLLLCYTMLQTIHLPSAKSFLRYTLCVVERPSQSLHEKWKKCRHDCGRLCQALLQSRTNEKDFRFDLVFY